MCQQVGFCTHTPLLQNFKKVFLLYHAPVPFFTSLWQGAIMYPTIIAYLLTCYYIKLSSISLFSTLFLKLFFFFLSCLCLFFLLHMQWSNSHPSWKSYPSVKEVGSSHCVKLYMNIGISKKGHPFDVKIIIRKVLSHSK